MYCSYCAAVLTPNQLTCDRCGRPVPNAMALAPEVAGARPMSIRIAAILLMVCWLISTISLFSTAMRVRGITMSPVFLIRSGGFWVIWIICIAFFWQRQNWARIVILLLVLWNVCTLLLTLARFPNTPGLMISLTIGLVTCALRILASYFMFRPDSNAWFART